MCLQRRRYTDGESPAHYVPAHTTALRSTPHSSTLNRQDDRERVEVLYETKLRNPAITTLAELVKYSPDLQKLVALGVSMHKVERRDEASDLLANLKYYPTVHSQ